jgi:hypothetical protein
MAQTEKGKLFISAGTTLGIGQSDGLMGMAFNRSTLELADGSELEDRTNSFFLATKGGYFIADGFVAGLELALSTSSGSTETDGVELESSSSFLEQVLLSGIICPQKRSFLLRKLAPFSDREVKKPQVLA